MDAYQQQQPHRYMRPPPPPLPSQPLPPADPHLQYHPQYHHQPPPPPPRAAAPPPQGSWYSNQFHYQQHHNQSHSTPSPPPLPQQHPSHWGPPPHSDHSAYPPPAPLPCPAHPHNASNHFPPPPPPPPIPYLPPAQIPHSFSQVNQEWSNPNWSHHQGCPLPLLVKVNLNLCLSYNMLMMMDLACNNILVPAHNNVEDWGAKAREWAKTRAAMQDQPVQSQITPAGRPEEQNRFHDPYSQAVDSHHMDAQQLLVASNYQQFPVPAASPHRPPTIYPNETLSNSSGPSSYIPDGRLPYHARDGTSALDPKSGFLLQESLPTSSSVHQQEVPSSYSSVSGNNFTCYSSDKLMICRLGMLGFVFCYLTPYLMPGKEDSANQKEQSYKTLPLPISSAQEAVYHMQPALPDIGRSVLSEQSFVYGTQTADPAADLSDRPLDFAPRFNNDHDPQMQSNYAAHHESMGTVRGIDPTAAASSINSWTPPVAPGAVFPPLPPVLPPGPQHDPSLAVPSPVSGHTAPSFPRFPGPSFQPSIPSASAPFGLATGAPLQPTTAFPGDTYGTISERPKKGPVPNWLKEEILRNKATIAKSSLEQSKEETQSIEDEAVDKSLAKGDQADSKSIDSSRSTEEEDDDEDYVEAARTAAINQEIKRVLTEVLLKVTDELFDEIATKVVNEDDLTVEVDHNTVASNYKVSPSSSPVPTPKASARVLVPGKAKESETVGVGEKSSSSSPGNVLGLANYASEDEDENEDNEIQSSRMPDSRSNAAFVPSSVKKLLQDNDASENSNSQVELDEHNGVEKNFGSDVRRLKNNRDKTTAELSDNSADRNHDKSFSSKVVSGDEINFSSGKLQERNNDSGLNDTLGEQVIKKSDYGLPDTNTGKRSTKSESQGRETRLKSDKNDRPESRKSSFQKDPGGGRELEVRSREYEKGVENHLREDERLRKQKTEDRNGSKERVKEHKTGEKAKESDKRKRSNQLNFKDDKKDAEKSHRASAKEDVDRKRERTKEEDRSRHKHGNDSSRHKRRRSSSIGSRGRNSKDNSSGHANDSSDEASDGSKRKLHSRKRHSSPSPVRSRKRQVSRSPHSKHSQRRHSPYSSFETTRGRRS
ncbi:Cyclin-related, putative isoform 1 [Theobroma cacao]|uniref:Cyclin-related, putative isoform 1 n=1 Tax=Theobroma cacao TaxID=3641 RepID=A0A061E6K1_THECC|nr:Cyclin-related, putative isoform 1 [Theobroma cacao]